MLALFMIVLFIGSFIIGGVCFLWTCERTRSVALGILIGFPLCLAVNIVLACAMGCAKDAIYARHDPSSACTITESCENAWPIGALFATISFLTAIKQNLGDALKLARGEPDAAGKTDPSDLPAPVADSAAPANPDSNPPIA